MTTPEAESRLRKNQHFAAILRQRLESRHANSTYIRNMLSRLTDAELIDTYLKHERLLIEQVAKLRASEVAHD
ncbi:MAG TPA: hypothetical protein VNV41_04420 [Candidatus Acidoferrales bacterium]|jgi:hypothetical protein|nr:hypothetical protein [Candidatus Acidoferrales bacterium]